MGRLYAGILGPTAFLVIVVRGLIQSGSPESIVVAAIVSLVAFSGLGYIAGSLAAWIIAESVAVQFAQALGQQDAPGQDDEKGGNNAS